MATTAIYHKMKEAGLCPGCGRKVDREGVYCQACVEKERTRYRETRASTFPNPNLPPPNSPLSVGYSFPEEAFEDLGGTGTIRMSSRTGQEVTLVQQSTGLWLLTDVKESIAKG